MLRFLVRRIFLGILVMWLVTIAVFALFFLDPSGPAAVARRIGGKSVTPAQILLIEHRLGHPHRRPGRSRHDLAGDRCVDPVADTWAVLRNRLCSTPTVDL